LSPEISLEIPPRSPYVGVVRLAISALARTSGFTEEQVEDLKIAVSEACANAVIAHEEAGSQDTVSVSYADDGGRVVIEVGDRGRSDDGTPDEEADSMGISSRLTMSMALVESLVDECEFVPREGGGTVTRLVISH
jgi:serine/threonine-protein kinase RsbW